MRRRVTALALGLVPALALAAVALTASSSGAYFTDVERGEVSVSTGAWQSGPLAAALDLEPERLQQRGEGRPVVAFIDLPDGVDASLVEAGSIRLCRGTEPCTDGVAPASPPEVLVKRSGGRFDLKVMFDRAAALALVSDVAPPATVTFTVSGVAGGRTFSGSDTVELAGPDPPGRGPGVTETDGPEAAAPSPTPEPTGTPAG